jgi:hypothetical protein
MNVIELIKEVVMEVERCEELITHTYQEVWRKKKVKRTKSRTHFTPQRSIILYDINF